MARLFSMILLMLTLSARSQELFPNSEPASIIPKNVLGVRNMNESYSWEGDQYLWNGAMFMYGVNSKLMVSTMFTASNHHPASLPFNFVERDAEGNGFLPENSGPYAYKFESAGVGFRYRFLNFDGDHKHFRMALYGNGVYGFQPHDEAEITLMGDNKGVGGGLIATVLLDRLAVSATGGFIQPFSYRQKNPRYTIQYGKAVNYGLSFGYLLFPFKYKTFNETNVNLYTEFLGKTYDPLSVCLEDTKLDLKKQDELCEGSYIEVRPAIQFIVKSNLRIDLSTALPLISRSYIRQYPLYMINLQYYFFL